MNQLNGAMQASTSKIIVFQDKKQKNYFRTCRLFTINIQYVKAKLSSSSKVLMLKIYKQSS